MIRCLASLINSHQLGERFVRTSPRGPSAYICATLMHMIDPPSASKRQWLVYQKLLSFHPRPPHLLEEPCPRISRNSLCAIRSCESPSMKINYDRETEALFVIVNQPTKNTRALTGRRHCDEDAHRGLSGMKKVPKARTHPIIHCKSKGRRHE